MTEYALLKAFFALHLRTQGWLSKTYLVNLPIFFSIHSLFASPLVKCAFLKVNCERMFKVEQPQLEVQTHQCCLHRIRGAEGCQNCHHSFAEEEPCILLGRSQLLSAHVHATINLLLISTNLNIMTTTRHLESLIKKLTSSHPPEEQKTLEKQSFQEDFMTLMELWHTL